VSALLLGWITLRMSGHYLPLATIAWGLSLYYLMGNLDALGKYDGILGVPTLTCWIGTCSARAAAFFVLPGRWCCWRGLAAQPAGLAHRAAIRALKACAAH
jgi:branched-chain amino acid transport system permease protein